MIEPHLRQVVPRAEGVNQGRRRGASAMDEDIGFAPHRPHGGGGGHSVGLPVRDHGVHSVAHPPRKQSRKLRNCFELMSISCARPAAVSRPLGSPMTRNAQSLPSGAEPPAGHFANLSPFPSTQPPFQPPPCHESPAAPAHRQPLPAVLPRRLFPARASAAARTQPRDPSDRK